MSWRRLIDTRGDKAEIDWPRLAVVLVAGELIAGVLIWFLVESLGPVAAILVVAPIVAILIRLDVRMRRNSDGG